MPFLYQLFFKRLYLKIVDVSNQHILAEHAPNPLSSDSLMSSVLRIVVLYILPRFSVVSNRKINMVPVPLSCLEVHSLQLSYIFFLCAFFFYYYIFSITI